MATHAAVPEPLEDAELMLAYAAGDAAAFDTLHERHRAALYRFMLNGTGEAATANELYQDVWLRVIDHRESYTPQAPFRAWLFRIARNRLTDHYRRQPGSAALRFDEEQTSGQISSLEAPLQPHEVAELMQQGDRLHSALQRLPLVQREAVLLRHVAGMSLLEIATLAGEPQETVKSRIRYAMVKLRHTLRSST